MIQIHRAAGTRVRNDDETQLQIHAVTHEQSRGRESEVNYGNAWFQVSRGRTKRLDWRA